MPWGEEHTSRSSEMVSKAQERISADLLAIAVSNFQECRSTVNEEKMFIALERYRHFRVGGGDNGEPRVILLKEEEEQHTPIQQESESSSQQS